MKFNKISKILKRILGLFICFKVTLYIMNVKIKHITSKEALLVRTPVLRKNQPADSALIKEDYLSNTFHYGAFINNIIIGTSTIYPENRKDKKNQWRLRGMAVLDKYQSKGVGGELLDACINYIKLKNAEILWCNARIKAINFYTRHGFLICSHEFDIPNIGLHFQMEKKI